MKVTKKDLEQMVMGMARTIGTQAGELRDLKRGLGNIQGELDDLEKVVFDNGCAGTNKLGGVTLQELAQLVIDGTPIKRLAMKVITEEFTAAGDKITVKVDTADAIEAEMKRRGDPPFDKAVESAHLGSSAKLCNPDMILDIKTGDPE